VQLRCNYGTVPEAPWEREFLWGFRYVTSLQNWRQDR
jgi:hypothetical protein